MSNLTNNTASLQSILNTVNTLPDATGGIELPELTNEGSASELFSGKELIDSEGNVVTGTFSIDDEIATQDDLIAQIQSAVDSLPDAGDTEFVLQNKTVTPTASSQTVTADSGYDALNSVVVNGDENLVAENIISGVSIFGIEGSASGGSGSIPIINVTITDNAGLGGVFYFNENGKVQMVIYATANVNALAGIVFIRSPMESITATGNYIASGAGMVNAVMFLEDGGAAEVNSGGGA